MRAPTLALALALPLAACGGGGGTATAPDPCPQVAVVAGLDALEARPAGSSELAHAATLDLVGVACRYDPGVAVVDLAVHLNARAGPARGESARIDYFVAVLGPDGGLVDKRVFTSEIVLPAAPGRAGYEERLRQVIPGVGPGEAGGWRVLVGLQPDEATVARLLQGG